MSRMTTLSYKNRHLKERLKQNLPVDLFRCSTDCPCLRCQSLCRTSKEIGWSATLKISDTENNLLSALIDTPVLHWHGDTFDLPENTTLLGCSDLYPNQAFTLGKNILALQFHVEVAADSLEKWLIGHTCELRHAHIDITALREDNQRYASALEQVSGKIIQQYLCKLKQNKLYNYRIHLYKSVIFHNKTIR